MGRRAKAGTGITYRSGSSRRFHLGILLALVRPGWTIRQIPSTSSPKPMMCKTKMVSGKEVFFRARVVPGWYVTMAAKTFFSCNSRESYENVCRLLYGEGAGPGPSENFSAESPILNDKWRRSMLMLITASQRIVAVVRSGLVLWDHRVVVLWLDPIVLLTRWRLTNGTIGVGEASLKAPSLFH